jgi:hypothetical protein
MELTILILGWAKNGACWRHSQNAAFSKNKNRPRFNDDRTVRIPGELDEPVRAFNLVGESPALSCT